MCQKIQLHYLAFVFHDEDSDDMTHNVLHNQLILEQVYLLYIEHQGDINNIYSNFKTKTYPGRALRTPYTTVNDRIRRRIRPYPYYIRSVYDRISPDSM